MASRQNKYSKSVSRTVTALFFWSATGTARNLSSLRLYSFQANVSHHTVFGIIGSLRLQKHVFQFPLLLCNLRHATYMYEALSDITHTYIIDFSFPRICQGPNICWSISHNFLSLRTMAWYEKSCVRLKLMQTSSSRTDYLLEHIS